MDKSFRIGRLAELTGLTIKAIRYYEARGLLPPAARTEAGYRLYSEADVHRLEFIRNAKALGLSLRQLQDLTVTAQERTCARMRPKLLGVLEEQIDRTVRQIQSLRAFKQELESRRRSLLSRPLTDHGQGYCSCLDGGPPVLPPRLLNLEHGLFTPSREHKGEER